MILKRLILNNFRQFKGKTVINFSPSKDKHVVFVYASNGVGKTTLLSSIVWCLYGGDSLEYVDQKNIFLNKVLFRDLALNEELTVDATLVFEDRDKNYTVKRSVVIKNVNKEQKIVSQTLDVQINNESQHHNPQEKINSVLSPAMKEYFFFKGEGVQKFAEESNYQKVQHGIKNIMKIDTREKAVEYIEFARKKFASELKDMGKENGNIELPESKKESLLDEKMTFLEKIEQADKDIEQFDDIIQRIEVELSQIKELKVLTKDRDDLLKALEASKTKYEELINTQKNKIVQQAYIALSHQIFSSTKQIIDKKRETGVLPVGIRKKFVEELILNNLCICGTTFSKGDEHYNKLLKIIDTVSDDTAIEDTLNELSYFVEAKRDIPSNYLIEYRKLSDEIIAQSNITNELEEKKTSLEDVMQIELPQNEDNLITRKKSIILQRDERVKSKAIYEDSIKRIDLELKEIETQISKLDIQNEAINLVRKRIAFCQEAIDILSEENTKIIEQIRTELSTRLNTKFHSILRANKNAKINEDFKLIITEEGDDEIASGKSDGEGQLISLLFISTLIDMARQREQHRNHNDIDPGAGIYPIVIDSPYGQFDTVYKKYISEVVRDMAPQVIILLNQEQWNDGKDLFPIFKEKIAHQYVLIAHRPKLNNVLSKNTIRYNDMIVNMEVVDTEEYTEIKDIKEFE